MQAYNYFVFEHQAPNTNTEHSAKKYYIFAKPIVIFVRMKVIHINGAGSWGGNEQQLADLIPELGKLQVKNMVMGRPNAPLHHYCIEKNIPFIKAQDGKLSKKANFRFLKEIAQQEKPDVLHLHTSDSVTLFTISDILYKLKTPTVFSKKGIGRSSSFLSKTKYNYKNLDRIICVSKAVKVFMERDVIKPKNHKKLVVVYDGINTDRLVPIRKESLHTLFDIPTGKMLIGNIANHAGAKDLPTLLRMMHYLVYELNETEVHLIQIGEFTGITEELKNLTMELKLQDYVTFTGFQDHATDFLSQMDLYVMSSEREGLPLTIYEAFYKRIPVASTRAGGIPEIISDGENGFLVDVGDYKKLAEKSKIILENKALAQQFCDKSHELFMTNFSADKTAEHVLDIYKSIQ